MFGGRRAPVALCIALAATSAAALGACGGDDEPSAEQIQQIKEEARREALADARSRAAVREARETRRELERLKDRQSSGGGTASGSAASGGGSTSCGDGLSVNSVTTCPFAGNVRAEYQASGGASTIYVYSPVTQQTYRMSCTGAVPVVCTGGDDAAVYIR